MRLLVLVALIAVTLLAISPVAAWGLRGPEYPAVPRTATGWFWASAGVWWLGYVFWQASAISY